MIAGSSVNIDLSPESSASTSSPPRCRSFGSTSSSELDLVDDAFVKRSKRYPNSEVVEQNCLRPSVARALFQQLDTWLSRKDTVDASKYNLKTPWPKKKHRCDKEIVKDDSLGMTRTLSMPGGIPAQSKCHCVACCSCTPRDRLEGICSVYTKLSTSTTSLDTGLATLGFSPGYNPMIQPPSNDSFLLENDDAQNACIGKFSPIATTKCNSLPSHASGLKHKICTMCSKLLSPTPIIKGACDDTAPAIADMPTTSSTYQQLPLPELDFCVCHQKCSTPKDDSKYNPSYMTKRNTSSCQAQRVITNSADIQNATDPNSCQYQPKVGPSEFKERVGVSIITFANVVGRMLCIHPRLSVCLFVCLSVCLFVC